MRSLSPCPPQQLIDKASSMSISGQECVIFIRLPCLNGVESVKQGKVFASWVGSYGQATVAPDSNRYAGCAWPVGGGRLRCPGASGAAPSAGRRCSPDADAHADAHANADADTHANADTNAHAHANTHAYANTYANTHANASP